MTQRWSWITFRSNNCIANYLQQLKGLSLAALAAATRDAVQQWMDRAAGAEAVAGLPVTRSGRSDLNLKLAVLAKGQAALKFAIQQGREKPVDRAIRILEAALGDVIIVIKRQAAEEDCSPARS
jgi:hypothetical protein